MLLTVDHTSIGCEKAMVFAPVFNNYIDSQDRVKEIW